MTVAIIDAGGDVVATLVRDQPVPRYKQFSLRWTGREGTAKRAAGSSRTASGRTILRARTPRPAGARGEYRVEVSAAPAGPHGALAAQLHAGESVSGPGSAAIAVTLPIAASLPSAGTLAAAAARRARGDRAPWSR